MEQKHPSAKTSLKQIPAGFKIIDKHFGWKPHTLNFDIGGGKYDLMTEKLKEKQVANLIFDPYNRTQEHNESVLSICRGMYKADTVTIFNVLNVIEEYEIQIAVLNLALEVLKEGGVVFVRSAYMNPSKASGITKSGTFQHYKTQTEYLEIVKRVFPKAELKHGLIFSKK